MIYSFTGIFYFFATIVFTAFVYRIWKVYQEQRADLIKFLLYGFGFLLALLFIATVTGLFFVNSSIALRLTVMVGILFQALSSIFLIQAFFPIVFPKIPPKIVQGLIILLILIIEILYYQSGKTPFLGPFGFIDWDIPLSIGVIRVIILTLWLIPGFMVFINQIKGDKNEKARKKAILFAVAFGIGFILVTIFSVLFGSNGVSEAGMLIVITFILGLLILWTERVKN